MSEPKEPNNNSIKADIGLCRIAVYPCVRLSLFNEYFMQVDALNAIFKNMFLSDNYRFMSFNYSTWHGQTLELCQIYWPNHEINHQLHDKTIVLQTEYEPSVFSNKKNASL